MVLGLLQTGMAMVLMVPAVSAKSLLNVNSLKSVLKNAVFEVQAVPKNNPSDNTKVTKPQDAAQPQQGVFQPQGDVRPPEGQKNPGGIKPFNPGDAVITVEYLNNGIKETFVSKTASVIAQMKQFVKEINKAQTKIGDAAKINIVAEATSTGMVITTTSSDADLAAGIIGRSRIRELEKKLIEAKVDIRAAIKRTVQETEKGVVVTISSDNADVAQLIKLREKYPMEEFRPGPLPQPGNKPNLPPGQEKKINSGVEGEGQENQTGVTGQDTSL